MGCINPNLALEAPSCDDRLLWDVWVSWLHLRSLNVADKIGLFSFLLNNGPSNSEEIAKALSMGLRAAEALLGVLTALGFLVRILDKYHLAEVSRNYLIPESPFYWGNTLRLTEEVPLTAAILQNALERDGNMLYNYRDSWEVHEENSERAKAFTSAMHSHSFPAAVGAARWGNFSGIIRMLDVGGGSGCSCIALAQRYTDMFFTVLDLPVVCKLAQKYIAEYGLAHRIETIAANMFKDPWPEGFDAVHFMNIFHDWDENSCMHLVSRSFDTLPKSGRIFIHEMLLEESKAAPLTVASMSMAMVLAEHGKQYMAGELVGMLRRGGFQQIEITPTYGYFTLISGTKP